MPVRLQQQQQQSALKKLLVLDVNGLLVARYKKSDKGKPPNVEHGVVAKTCIYKRPLCDAFLQFCLENFHVGIWSSMMECNVNKVLDYICSSSTSTTMKHRFAFVMHQRDCTNTKFSNPEKREQPLFLKDLRNVWARFRPGEFNEKNTLLIDDTPYKALHNPPHTAIFPEAYTYDETDTFLMGPLRRFLVQLIGAPDVQEFVRSHPIGAPAISPGSPHWGLYRKIVQASNIRSHSQVSNSHTRVQLDGPLRIPKIRKSDKSYTSTRLSGIRRKSGH